MLHLFLWSDWLGTFLLMLFLHMNASLFSFNHVNFCFLPFYLNLERNLIKPCGTFYWNPLNHRWCSLIFRYFSWRQFGIIIMCVILLSKVTHMTTGVILHLNLICLELPFPSWHYLMNFTLMMVPDHVPAYYLLIFYLGRSNAIYELVF